MALGTTPSLTEINTEIGTTGQSLVTCIANVGKTGTWDRQSDFASYIYVFIDVLPTSILIAWNDISESCQINSSSDWQVRTPLPTGVISVLPTSGSNGDSSVVSMTENESVDPRLMLVVFELQSDTSIADSIGITQSGM